MIHDYRVFGGHLRSVLAFPELRPPPSPHPSGAPDWTIDVAAPTPFPDAAELLGANRYAGGVDVRLLRAGGRLRVETSDIGCFDLEADGRAVVWRPAAGAREELARFDLLGRVLPLALHLRGALALHGSSVVIADGAVTFLAPKGAGKSTLALALAQRGARLLSDDVTVVERAGEALLARPGVHAVRLWRDSAERLETSRYGAPGAIGPKLVVHGVPDALRADQPAPLRAVYLLSANAPAGALAARRPLPPTAATLGIVRQVTAGSLLGGPEARRVLERAAAVAREIPVFALDIARDFARLDEVAAVVAAWHDAGRAARSPVEAA